MHLLQVILPAAALLIQTVSADSFKLALCAWEKPTIVPQIRPPIRYSYALQYQFRNPFDRKRKDFYQGTRRMKWEKIHNALGIPFPALADGQPDLIFKQISLPDVNIGRDDLKIKLQVTKWHEMVSREMKEWDINISAQELFNANVPIVDKGVSVELANVNEIREICKQGLYSSNDPNTDELDRQVKDYLLPVQSIMIMASRPDQTAV